MRTISLPVCLSWMLEARLVRNTDTTPPSPPLPHTPLHPCISVSKRQQRFGNSGQLFPETLHFCLKTAAGRLRDLRTRAKVIEKVLSRTEMSGMEQGPAGG